MIIAFVILNYNTHTEAIECINSISDKIDTDDYKILIVDNASKQEDIEILKKKYDHSDRVVIIQNEKNLGFANGNNRGIDYVNKNWNPDFVAVINSDTELIQRDLVAKLQEEYLHSQFALLGPLVLNADGRCDNSPHFDPTIETVTDEIRCFQKEVKYIALGLYRPYCAMKKFQSFFEEKVLRRERPIHRNKEFHLYQQDVVLQGCFLVFSRKVFEVIKGFDPRTFLYYEEPLLFLALRRHGLTTVFDPEICVYHKDGMSTKKISNNKKRLLFIKKCYIDSANILLNELKRKD